MNRFFITVVFALFISSLFSQSNYHVIYEANSEGKALYGEISDLINAIENGQPVRVGWAVELHSDGEKKILQHWTDAKFITILDNVVYAQIDPIYQQMTSFSEPKGAIKLLDNIPNGWVAIISSTGLMRQKFADPLLGMEDLTEEQSQKLIKQMELSKVATKWAIGL